MESDAKTPPNCDADGYPLDPAHPWHASPVAWHAGHVDTPTARKLRQLENAWRAGHRVAAVADAVKLCNRHGLPLPGWTAAAVVRLLSDPDALVSKRGRLAKAETTERENRKHFVRWDAVRELRDRKDELAECGYRPTWEDAYANVADALEGTEAAGSPEVVKKSYQLVNKLLATEQAGRFYVR